MTNLLIFIGIFTACFAACWITEKLLPVIKKGLQALEDDLN